MSVCMRKGVLDLPGSSSEAKKLVGNLLLKDADSHHCFYRSGRHNHLSHHLLAAYDLGASPGLLQHIYDDEARVLRPILLDDADRNMVVNEETWSQYVGNNNAYHGFISLFRSSIERSGVLKTLEKYLFSPPAKDALMLVRLMSGAVHPLIQLGYGLEFGNHTLVASGLAQAAVHSPLPPELFNLPETPAQPGLSLLEILRQVYDSPTLKPVMPYDPNALISARINSALSEGRMEEIKRICSQFCIDDSLGELEFDKKLEECILVSTLLLFATGKEGREPRLDFFLMHLLTSSLLLKPYLEVLKNPSHKAELLRAYVLVIILLTMSRGRPVIKPNLLMSYTDVPRPPQPPAEPHNSAIGNPCDDKLYNPWPAMIESCFYAPDAHVLKTMRSLIFAAKKYGDTPPGGAIGAFLQEDPAKETHPGTAKMDGSIFVRGAGMLLDSMGWVGHGQAARDWDRSALGWEEAWSNGE